jgi:predicted molibdopterin-dependent oxidoreductase YjgC
MLKADRIVETTCPFCGVGCQIDLHIRDEQIFRVSGRFYKQLKK